MTEREKIERDIATLRESLRLDFEELGRMNLDRQGRRNLRTHAAWCVHSLNGLIIWLDQLDKQEEDDAQGT